MSNTNTGGPAFPIQGHSTRNGQGFQLVMAYGMTLRDYFAAKAMQAILDSSQYQCAGGIGETANLRGAAEDSYAMADAMLKARGA